VGNPGSANRWRTSSSIATVMRSAIASFGWAAATRSEPAEQEVIRELIHHRKGRAAASMRHVRLGQVLAAILGAWMVILVIVPVLLGMAIQQGMIAPPQLDVTQILRKIRGKQIDSIPALAG
jgi:hypothetical protein